MPDYEHTHQRRFFTWVAQQALVDWRYNAVYAVPNGGRMTVAARSYLLQEGMQKGVPDICVAVPKIVGEGPYGVEIGRGYRLVAGLYVELKTPRRRNVKSAVSDDQLAWLDLLFRLGHRVEVAYGLDELQAIVESYMCEGGDTDAY